MIGLKPQQKVMIWAKSSLDWHLMDLSILCNGSITIPVHHDISEEDFADKDLTPLDLSFGQLTAVPRDIWNRTNLTELRLGSNFLKKLPAKIGNLTSLTTLNLGFNELTALPPAIGNLTSLTDLYLEFNNLKALPPEIWNLTNLVDWNRHARVFSELVRC